MEAKKKFYRSTPKSKLGENKGPKKDHSEKKEFRGKKEFKKGVSFKGKSNHDFKKGSDKKEFSKDKSFKKDEKSFAKKDFKDRKFNDRKDNRNTSITIDKNEPVNVRFYCYQCLYNIYVNKAFVNIEVDHFIRNNNMNDADKNLFTKIVYGTLQKNSILNWELGKLSEKKPKDDAKVIILMSLYQLHYLDKVPDFAIINEAVEIAKKIGDFVAKYVNAVLRESTRQNLSPKEEDFKTRYDYLSVVYNTPAFIIKMWERHYGMTKTMQILEANQKEAPMSLRCNTNKEEIIANNPNFVEGKLAKNALIYMGSNLQSCEEFKQGLVSIQDESSQYVVEVLDPSGNDKVLDMCAAPGSKSAYISTLLSGGKLLSIDVYQHRVDIMKKYFDELKLSNVTCVCYDSTTLDKKEKLLHSFDKVLLDAPCSGLGVIRRKPDVLFDISPDKLDELVVLQEKLLDQAYLMIKENGVIVYSTCSMNKKENDAQITTFLAKHKDMTRVFEKQIFPDEYDSDGFYIAKLVKKQ